MSANSTQASHKIIRTFFTQQCANLTATFGHPSKPYAGKLIEKSTVTEFCRANGTVASLPIFDTIGTENRKLFGKSLKMENEELR